MPSSNAADSVTVNEPPPFDAEPLAGTYGITCPRMPAAPCDATSGHARYTFRRYRPRLWPERHTRTSGRHGNRQDGISRLTTSLISRFVLLSRKPMCAAQRPPGTLGTGEPRVPCRAAPTYSSGSGAARPFPAIVSAFPFLDRCASLEPGPALLSSHSAGPGVCWLELPVR